MPLKKKGSRERKREKRTREPQKGELREGQNIRRNHSTGGKNLQRKKNRTCRCRKLTNKTNTKFSRREPGRKSSMERGSSCDQKNPKSGEEWQNGKESTERPPFQACRRNEK